MMIEKQDKLNVFTKVGTVFIAIMLIAFFGMTMVYLYVDAAIYDLIVFILMIVLALIVLLSVMLLAIIKRAFKNNKINTFMASIINGVIRFVMPSAVELSRLLGIDKNIVRSFFVDFNNIIVNSLHPQCTSDRLLVLVPHCLQWSECNLKITNNPYNCKQCGQCDMSEILNITKKYGVKISVASGGTMARKAIYEDKPDVIISVACSRDLMSGIVDIEKVPVIAVENSTPNGPCNNTKVAVDKIEQAIIQVLRA